MWWPGRALPFDVTELNQLSPQSVCLANPALAPYGAAAWSLLVQSGLDREWLASVVRVDNVNLVAGMVAQNQVSAGFVARASINTMMRRGDLPADQSVLWLSPTAAIRQDLVLLRRGEGNPAARWWVEQLFEPPIQQLLVSHGYQLPNEAERR